MNFVVKSIVTNQLTELLKEFKNVFAQTYKDLKGIPPEIVQYQIELDTTIPLVHQARYWLNPNYVVIIKQDIYYLLIIGFIKLVEDTTKIHDLLRGSS